MTPAAVSLIQYLIALLAIVAALFALLAGLVSLALALGWIPIIKAALKRKDDDGQDHSARG